MRSPPTQNRDHMPEAVILAAVRSPIPRKGSLARMRAIALGQGMAIIAERLS